MNKVSSGSIITISSFITWRCHYDIQFYFHDLLLTMLLRHRLLQVSPQSSPDVKTISILKICSEDVGGEYHSHLRCLKLRANKMQASKNRTMNKVSSGSIITISSSISWRCHYDIQFYFHVLLLTLSLQHRLLQASSQSSPDVKAISNSEVKSVPRMWGVSIIHT